MANKFFTKALSVGLSLTLCAGLVAPALAASFTDLQNAIDGVGGTAIDENRTGYGEQIENGYEIEAWNGEDDTRNVEVNANVTWNENDDKDTTSITVGEGQKVNLDLNGNTIDGGNRREILENGMTGPVKQEEKTGSKDSVIEVTGEGTNLTVEDGAVTGGYAYQDYGGGIKADNGAALKLDGVTVENNESTNRGGGVYAAGAGTTVDIKNSTIQNNEAGAGGGIYANQGAHVTVEDTEITKNVSRNGGGVGAAGDKTEVTLKDTDITWNDDGGNNYGHNNGGGINVTNGATVTMDKGSVSHNSMDYGGGVYVGSGEDYMNRGDENKKATFTATGTKIEENTTDDDGGGIYVDRYQNVNLENVVVKENTANYQGDGGGIYNNWGTVTTNGGEISGNHVTRTNGGRGGGVYNSGTFQMSGKTLIYGNTLSPDSSDSYGTDIYNTSRCTLVLFDIGKGDNVQRDGKTITGWRAESRNNRWSEDRDDSQTVRSKYGKHEVVSGKWTNYYFWGNEKLEGFGENGTGTIEITEGISLIAAYDKYFDVKVANDDGTPVEGVKLMVERKDTVDGEVLDSIKRDGYKLEGWTLMDSAGNDLGKDGEVTGEDFTVVLKWHHHTPGTATQENVVAATCTTTGSYDEVVTCTECGDVISTLHVDTPMAAHTPGEWTVVTPAQIGVPGLEHQLCTVCETELATRTIAALPTPPAPDTGDDGGDPEIGDQAIPLAAGPVTRAEFLDYLWRHEGEPASDGVCTFTDVPEEHEFILALAWAEQNGIAKAYEDGAFEPDELVTVSAVREFLGNFARVFGGNAVAVSALSTLTGEADEAVVNCDEVLAEFFGEEYVSAKDQGEKLAA